jgi:hypothetical protein
VNKPKEKSIETTIVQEKSISVSEPKKDIVRIVEKPIASSVVVVVDEAEKELLEPE